MNLKTKGKTASHLYNLNFVWIHAGVTFYHLPVLIFQSSFFAFKNMFWYLGHSGVRRETTSDIKWWKYITYQVLFLFPKWLLLRLGDGYNFRVSVLMTFSRNILDSRKMLVSTFLVLPTRHVSTVITGAQTWALTSEPLEGKAGKHLTR